MAALLPSSNWFGLGDQPHLRATAGAWSTKGSRRENNEDCKFISPKHDLFIVADGMGGHAAGELASRFVVDTLTHELAQIAKTSHSEPEMKRLVKMSVNHAHCLVVAMRESEPECYGAGSTVVLALLFGSRLFVTGVGDSMAYLLREDSLNQLNESDSYAALLESLGKISHEEARTHPARHQLLSVLGMKDFAPDKAIRVLDVRPGDRFLLATDGVTDSLNAAEITNALQESRNCRVAAQRLVEQAVKNGSTDDATCVVFAIREVLGPVADHEKRKGVMATAWDWMFGQSTFGAT